jgi:Surface lipoprotein
MGRCSRALYYVAIFGPRTLRSTANIPAEIATSPLTYTLDEDFWIEALVTGVDLIDTRSRFLQFDETLQLQLDRYATVRSAYYNSRRQSIYDGNLPETDDLDPFDDEFEESLEDTLENEL